MLVTAADTYVVVVALPDIATGVGISIEDIPRVESVVSAFLLGYCAMLPLVGRLSDRAGRMPVLLGCLLIFCIGSSLTAAADALPLLLVGRALQGLGGGGLVPATLGLVADEWTPVTRGLPLGIVGAAQELGALVGPLLGAGLLVLTSWRGIFLANLAAGVVLAVLAAVVARLRARADLVGLLLTLIVIASAALLLVAPASLVDDVTYGEYYLPQFGDNRITSPIGLVLLGAALLLLVRSLTAQRPLVPLRALGSHLRAVDLPGAVLLSAALACVILAFSPADPTAHPVARGWLPLLAAALVLGVGFVIRQVRANDPLVQLAAFRPRPAWGALAVSVLVGTALIAVLVEVPLFARLTVYPDSQTDAALVLVRFLAAVPVGALAGGWLLGRVGPAPIAGAGMLLAAAGVFGISRWGASALGGGPRASDVVLAVAGVGIGLAVAPVNAALLGAVNEGMHGTASALAVVARTIGQLVGLSGLTAVGLSVFGSKLRGVGTAAALCPDEPVCKPYTDAVRSAAIDQAHAVLATASVAALAAAVLCILLLGRSRSGVRVQWAAASQSVP